MKHPVALLTKLVLIELVFVVGLQMAGATFTQAFLVGLVNTVILYFLGDLVILPRTNNTVATGADIGTAFLATWLAPLYTDIPTVSVLTALMAALAVAIVEFFFHHFMRDSILPGPPTNTP